MIKLLVIADDFTGALDTGVQFAGKGMTTKVLNYFPEDEETLKRLQAEVLVIDAQTRHLEGQEAYRKVCLLYTSNPLKETVFTGKDCQKGQPVIISEFVPVSYTHLDVYKRQSLWSRQAERP